MKTYRLNHPQVPDDRMIVSDIRDIKAGSLRKLVGRKRIDVLVGAPPCQGYSSAGFRSKKTHTGYQPDEDERNFLFEYMVRAAAELKPKLFLMENVPGMQSARKENLSFLESAAKEARENRKVQDGDLETQRVRIRGASGSPPLFPRRIKHRVVARPALRGIPGPISLRSGSRRPSSGHIRRGNL